ncbi:MAG: PKD domain-containing protein, partial [Actinomycetota bacterium]|nr:PKD domain-containing protein [Actinomycetota bacterium]
STSHGWFHTPQLANGTLTPGGFVDKECAQGVLCTVQFYLTDDTNTPTGNKWLLTSFVGSGGQFVIPLTSTAPPASPPAAAFSASLSGTATHDWNFVGSASMAGTGQTLTRFQWTFGDGTTSITAAPTTHHTYADGSPHTASLVVLDSAGASSASVSHTLTEPMLVVNSAGDAPATDPSHGCDTGQKVQNGDTECTLRAAIQSLDAGVGGTEITFRLPAGSTTITATSALPHVTAANATILGSTSAMPVISGSGLEVIGASGVTIANLVILGGSTGVRFQDSPDGKLTGSYIGVTPSGQVSAPPEGVWVDGGGGYAISGNVIVATVSGMTVTPSAPITSLKVIGNSVGELPNGSLALGVQYGGGIGLFALTGSIAGADVEDNRIAGADTNLAVVGDQVIAPRIAGNTIGVSGDQVTLLGKATQNLRVDGAPRAQITGNTIAGAKWDLLVSGSVQTQLDTSSDGSQSLGFLYPGGFPLSSPITGTHVTVSGNSVGPVTRQDGANLLHGITVWNTANDTTISDNIARDHDTDEIAASGVATGLTVSNNVVGGAPGTPVGGEDGIVVADQTAPTVSTNTIGAVATGITIPATTIGAVVSGNTVGLWTDGTSVSKTGIGIDVKGAAATIGPDNTIGFSTLSGIFIHAAGAHVISNRIGVAKFGSGFAGNATGIQVAAGATGAKIGGSGSGNTIVGNVTGVLLEEQGAEVSWNKFGVLTGGILGNIT